MAEETRLGMAGGGDDFRGQIFKHLEPRGSQPSAGNPPFGQEGREAPGCIICIEALGFFSLLLREEREATAGLLPPCGNFVP